MALPIIGARLIQKVDRAALIAEGEGNALAEADAQAAIDDLIAEESALGSNRCRRGDLELAVASSDHHHHQPARRLESGLGGNGSRSRRPTLDEAAARRRTP